MDEGGKVYGSEGEGRFKNGGGRGMVYGGGERNEKMEWENKNNSDAFVKVPPESALVHTYYILTTYLLHTCYMYVA